MSTEARADPGLQPERTTLARVRTAASFAALGALCVRFLPAAVGIAMLGGATVLLACTLRRHRRMCAEFEQGYVRPDWWWNVFLVLAVFFATGATALHVVGEAL